MIGGCYGLQVHSNTYNFIMFTGVLCKSHHQPLKVDPKDIIIPPPNQNMSKKPLTISESAAVQMPMKTVASSDNYRGTWHHGLFQMVERLNQTAQD